MCAPGIEAVTAAELRDLGLPARRTFPGGVEMSATDRQLYAANLWLRTATRVLVRAGRFHAATFPELERHLSAIPWDRWLAPGTTPAVRVSSTASHLYHTGAVADRVTGASATGSEPGPLVVVRLIHDRVTVSVDSSGAPLHERGWRLASAKAPLRETLAAAVVIASGWDRRSPLVDPFCGAGTIAIEAALLAAGAPPGGAREFAFQRWPSFAPGTWASVTAAATAPAPEQPPLIVASDRDAGAVAATEENAARAGVADRLEVAVAPMSSAITRRADVGWLVTNPPYGKRLAGGDVRNLYARLGALARERLAGWQVALLVADARAAGHTGLPLVSQLGFRTGGIPVRLLAGPVRSG